MQAAGAACTGTAGAAREAAPASYAVQAEVSPCTAHVQRVLVGWPGAFVLTSLQASVLGPYESLGAAGSASVETARGFATGNTAMAGRGAAQLTVIGGSLTAGLAVSRAFHAAGALGRGPGQTLLADANGGLGALPTIEVNGVQIRPVDVRFGDPGRIAVIGRSMEGVEPYAAALRSEVAEVNIFSKIDSTIPAVARNEWDLLSSRYGKGIPENILPATRMFEANQSWAQLLNDENYTVINLGNPFNRPPSVFFDMEQAAIFGGSPR